MTEQKITKETIIAEALRIAPESGRLLFEEGVQCIGCGASAYETIEEGMLAHGKTEEEINNIVEEINKLIPKKIYYGNFAITDKAVKKLKEMLAEAKKEKSLRIVVITKGEEYDYDFSMVEEGEPDDKTITKEGLTINIEKNSEKALKGAVLDIVTTINGEGFHIDNPNKPEKKEENIKEEQTKEN